MNKKIIRKHEQYLKEPFDFDSDGELEQKELAIKKEVSAIS